MEDTNQKNWKLPSGMVSVDKALLNVLTSLIYDEVKKRKGSLKVGVSGDLSSEDDLETLSAIISALEPSSSTAAAPALAHMESSSFQPRRILNSIRFIQQCQRRLMVEKDDGRYESEELKHAFLAMIFAFSDMVPVEDALLNVLSLLISDEVKRRGSLEVGVNRDINSEQNLEMMSAIISAVEHQQQHEGTSSSAAAVPLALTPVVPITKWISQRRLLILNSGTRALDRILEDLVYRAVSRVIEGLFFQMNAAN